MADLLNYQINGGILNEAKVRFNGRFFLKAFEHRLSET